MIVDGNRVELPPTEFSLLAVLAARPGEVVLHRELLQEAFGDSAYMDIPDLHWRIWNIRRLIGDTERTIIRNRRGVGSVLEAERVEVIEGVAGHPVEVPPLVVRLEGEEPESHSAIRDEALEEKASEAQRAPWFFLSPVALVVLGLIAALVLGGSWLAGYTLSQRTEAPSTADAPPLSSKPEPDNQRQDGQEKKDNRKRPQRHKETPGRSGNGSSFAVGPSESFVTGDNTSGDQASAPSSDSRNPEPKSDGPTNEQPPPPPPQPNAQLYHLYNADSGDHIMTTSSSVANQKQAAGYESSLEGGVFTEQQKGTVAIALDSGTAYVYRDSSSAPDAVTVTALYKLSSGDDFFFTTSASGANQAQAQGWSRSTAGY
ncbi:MAG: winged helix-turn-helix domain-containing protein, partial [Actinobacteria bacterium]|nr:winged helix-turn-helix domain-containing protein [Actinomycetota bacterium]